MLAFKILCLYFCCIMVRIARKRSSWNMYHVILRREQDKFLFGDEEDFNKFIELLQKCPQNLDDVNQEQKRFYIYAYYISNTHVHLIIKEGTDCLASAIKRLTISYSYIFNNKYDRYGKVFYDRFMSEPIENQKTFLKVFSFIHNHPVNHAQSKKCADYAWSSWNEFFGKAKQKVCDKKQVFGLIARNKLQAFSESNNCTDCLDVDEREHKMRDKSAILVLCELAQCDSIVDIHNMSKREKLDLVSLASKKGLSDNQIARLLELTLYSVRKVLGKI